MSRKKRIDRRSAGRDDRLWDFEIRGRRARGSDVRIPVGGRRDGYPLPSAVGSAASRARFERIVKRVPEVMVKISSFASGRRSVLKQFSYFSRKGKLEVETEAGETLKGMDDMKELLDDWLGTGHHERPNVKRDTMNLILSMPPGTDPRRLRAASRAFAKEAFVGHRYFLVQHDDERHPHLHVTVKMQGEHRRLNPRKAQLQAWRELFAEKLRERGVEANATRRWERGRIRKAEPQQIRNMRDRGVTPEVVLSRIAEATREVWGSERHSNPFDAYLKQRQERILEALKTECDELSKSSNVDDQVLSQRTDEFVRSIVGEVSERESLVEAARHPNRQSECQKDTDRSR